MKPELGVTVTLVSRDVHAPYSGMLPGLIAGHYAFDETHIDLNVLARFANARFIHDSAVGIDTARRQVVFADRPPLHYDVLSINIGSSPTSIGVDGASEFSVGVKPISTFLERWEAMQARVIAHAGPISIAVVGAGAAGVEIVLAMQVRLAELRRAYGCDAPVNFFLVSASSQILPAFPPRVRRRFEAILKARGIRIFSGEPVVRVEKASLHTASRSLLADEVVWVTAAASAPWLKETGLLLDEKGFVQVGDDLRSVSHENVFAAGDIASMINHKRPKAGVFAVRQSAPLTENLRRAVRGAALKSFVPQRKFLTLLSTGDRCAVASRGRFSLGGQWAWRWKDHIDRKFMSKFSTLPEMSDDLDEGTMRCAGCGAKVNSAGLARALSGLHPLAQKNIISGLNAPDDAAIIDRDDDYYDLQTVDFFPAPISDPFIFGKIAASHALGDIFAMGGEPRTALAIASLPYAKGGVMTQTLEQMMSGAVAVLNQEGASLVGGHSAEGDQLALGFALTGVVNKNRLLTKSGLAPDNVLILTKPLGTGVLLAADMRARAKGRWIEAAIDSMLKSSALSARILREYAATGCTDVTGFGLAGHLLEMLKAAELDAVIQLGQLPLLDGAVELLARGFVSSAQEGNEAFAQPFIESTGLIDPMLTPIIYDPQTAGGLLAGVPANRAEACVVTLVNAGYRASVIGATSRRQGEEVRIRTL